MAENAADGIANATEATGGADAHVEKPAGFLEQVKEFAADEWSLLVKCAGSASPDRSSAGVLFLVLFAVSLTCTLSRYLLGSQPERFPDYVVPLLIIGFEVVAVVCLVLMMCYADTRPADDCVADGNLQPWHRFLRRNIKLFGIVPFYFAIFVFDIFRLMAELKCAGAWLACGNDDVRVEHIIDLVYPVARIVYLFFELIVCVKFNAANFKQNTLVLAGLAVVQATNLSAWLDALVDESVVFSSYRNSTYELSRCFNETTANVSHLVVKCFRRSTGEYKLLESASPYLYPFIVEYLMLVIECIADWFFSDAERHRPCAPPTVRVDSPSRPTSGVQSDAASTPPPNIGNSSAQPKPSTSYASMNDVEQQSLQGASANVSRSSSSNSVFQLSQGEHVPLLLGAAPVASTSTTNGPAADGFENVESMDRAPDTWCDRCPWFFVSVILSSIASFLFVIFGIFNLFLGEVGYLNVFMCYRTCYWLALTLATLIGYIVSRRFPSGPMNPSGFEYFVIFSSIGPILQSIFTMIANVRTDIFIMFLTEEITNILQICTQVVFYAYAKNIEIRTEGDRLNDNREFELLGRKRSILMGVLSYFAVCNFAIWVEDSFIETRSSETSWQKEYFDNWPVIYNMFNPLSLVFRFNSVLLFLNVLFDKRH